MQCEDLFRFVLGGCSWGKFLGFGREVQILYMVRLSRPIGEQKAFGDDALHECRDSACWRPFGVRLRGNGWFSCSLLHGSAAPLRMTQRGVLRV